MSATARLRVLRVIARLNVGGPARHVTILDRGLRARGCDTLLAHGEVGPDEASMERLLDIDALPAVRIPGLGRRISPTSDLRALLTLIRLVFRVQPDIVHTHTAKAGTLGRVAAGLYNLTRRRGRRCLVVHTFHGHVLDGYFGPAGNLLVRMVERALARVTDAILVLSSRQRDDIAVRFSVAPASRVHVVPLGLDLAPLLELPDRTRAEENGRSGVTFGFVGRLVPIKNLPLLIEAFASVQRQIPAARLLIAGDGEGRAAAEAMIAAKGLQASVELEGWREDLTVLYRQMDVMVLTSLNEGTPVAVIEAMAAAVPVVVTGVGGVPDVVSHEENGLVVPSGAVDALAGAMLRLARNAEDRERLGTAGRRAVRDRFAAPRLVSEVETLYYTGLEAKRRVPLAAGHASPRHY
jgi:glycosyltransferase involved in cell wall biosynthesis